jgi:outer membrane protein TolC
VKWLVALLVPSAALAEPVKFREAVQRAIAHNPDREVALQEIARVEGLLSQATSALLPQLGLSATYTRLEGDRLVMGRRAYAANSVIAQANIATPIVDLHAVAERKRARDTVAVTAAEADATKRDVAIATARAYFTAYSSARMMDIAQHARDAAQAQVDFLRERHKAGVSSELELARAEAELAIDEAQIASATTSKVRAEEALGVIMGSDRPASTAEEPDLGEPRDGPGIARRADEIAARRRTEAAASSRHDDWLDWVPTLKLAGDAFAGAPQIDPIPARGYELLLTLDIPLYDGGFRRGAHEQHVALANEAQIREAGTERQATSEIRAAREAVDDTRRARDASRTAAEKAQHALELAALGFHAGTATSLEVATAQQSALDAATRALLADDDFRSAELDLLAATGAFP